jgi:hypothetical protein
MDRTSLSPHHKNNYGKFGANALPLFRFRFPLFSTKPKLTFFIVK